MKKIIILLVITLQSCQWKYDDMIVKDAKGNLYRLEASGIRHESYDLKPLNMSEIDSLINNTP